MAVLNTAVYNSVLSTVIFLMSVSCFPQLRDDLESRRTWENFNHHPLHLHIHISVSTAYLPECVEHYKHHQKPKQLSRETIHFHDFNYNIITEPFIFYIFFSLMSFPTLVVNPSLHPGHFYLRIAPSSPKPKFRAIHDKITISLDLSRLGNNSSDLNSGTTFSPVSLSHH